MRTEPRTTAVSRLRAGLGRVRRWVGGRGRGARLLLGLLGLSARLAALAARGLLKPGDRYDHTSLIGTRFGGRIVAETAVAGRPAIVPAIRGRAWITGFHSYVVDPSDPYPAGYRVDSAPAGPLPATPMVAVSRRAVARVSIRVAVQITPGLGTGRRMAVGRS